MTTYSYTGAMQTHVVSADVFEIDVVVRGAAGGTHTGGGAAAGSGAEVSARIPVTPGETLNIYVGGAGGVGTAGWNGGGTSTYGGGGGASDIRRGTNLVDRVLVAAGGGGNSASAGIGGAGGYPTGAQGLSPGTITLAQGGTQSAGGTAGGTSVVGQNGALGVGGNAGGTGGGGGGGYYGGGGGGQRTGFGATNGGGAGGSSYLGPGIVGQSPWGSAFVNANQTGNGEVVVTEIVSDPNLVPSASGGTESDSDRYHIHTFTASGDLTVSVAGRGEALIIAGGGGGGSLGGTFRGGGGGAGGLIILPVSLEAGTMPVVVGAKGVGVASTHGTYGGDSSFAGVTAKGGGPATGGSGGSGGGGSGGSSGAAQATQVGTGLPGQGYPGQFGANHTTASNRLGGGGGGAGGSPPVYPLNFNGGPGYQTDFNGTPTYFAGGGAGAGGGTGGSGYLNAGGGGLGEIGVGTPANRDAQPGIVIIRYLLPFVPVGASFEAAGIMTAGVTVANPKASVEASLIASGNMTVQITSRVPAQPKMKRPLVWVYGLNGRKKNVVD